MDALLDLLRLPLIPDYIGIILLSFGAWTVLQYVIAPSVFKYVVGKEKWDAMDKRLKNLWLVHVVSLVHALVAVPLAVSCSDIPALDADRAFAWDARPGKLYAIATGYFLWDSMESLTHYEDTGFVIHAIACFGIYCCTFRPFLAYYASRFLLWEISTPFLDIHWFIDKTGRTGSRLQLINGILLLASFAGVRLIYGGVTSYQYFNTMIAVRHQIPSIYFWAFTVGNAVLQCLNWFWFTKMIAALRKRFGGPSSRDKLTGQPTKVVVNNRKVVDNDAAVPNGVAVIKGDVKHRANNSSKSVSNGSPPDMKGWNIPHISGDQEASTLMW